MEVARARPSTGFLLTPPDTTPDDATSEPTHGPRLRRFFESWEAVVSAPRDVLIAIGEAVEAQGGDRTAPLTLVAVWERLAATQGPKSIGCATRPLTGPAHATTAASTTATAAAGAATAS